MRKNFVSATILFIFFFCNLTAQDTPADIYYKDGKSFSGYGRLLKNNKVQFKRTKQTKSLKVDFKLLDSVVIHTENGDYLFKEVKVANIKKPIILEVLVTGKANLYGDTSNIIETGFDQYGVYSSKKAGYDKNNKLINMRHNGTRIITTDFFLQLTNDKEPKFLPLSNPLSSNFKKIATELFQDCPTLIAKIQNKEFTKKDMVEIVEYYNKNCL